MIKEFVAKWEANKHQLEEKYKLHTPDSYGEIVKDVVTILRDDSSYNNPDPERITAIDYGDYQGTLVYIIGCKSYQPSDYWYVRIYYGSCGGCDTLQAIADYSSDPPNEKQLKDYMLLALHILQKIKKMDDVEDEDQ